MCKPDQETEAKLAEIAAEWERLEAERVRLEAEFAAWREELLTAADEIGLGEAIRRRGRRRSSEATPSGQWR